MVDIRANLSADERRQRDEARLLNLEDQVAALRLQLQENASRQVATEVGRLRAEVADLDQRLSAAVVPIPHLQAQLADFSTQTRTQFQELGQDRFRFGELQSQIDRLPPQVERSAEIARGARDEVAAVRAEIEQVRKDWQKAHDAVGMV